MIESILQNKLNSSEKTLSEKAIRSRLARARKAERILDYSLDEAVMSDKKMYESLMVLKKSDKKGNLQNALRWYYRAKTGKQFPRIREYEAANNL